MMAEGDERAGEGWCAWLECRRSENWRPSEFHLPTFSNIMEQTSPLVPIHPACERLKVKDEVYLGRGRPLDIDGISSEGCDIGGCQGHP